MACLVVPSFIPAGSAATQALYNCGSCRSGHILPIASKGASRIWKKKQTSLLTTSLQRKVVRGVSPTTCCATLPESDGPYLKDLQVPTAWGEPSVAAQVRSLVVSTFHCHNSMHWKYAFVASFSPSYTKFDMNLTAMGCVCASLELGFENIVETDNPAHTIPLSTGNLSSHNSVD